MSDVEKVAPTGEDFGGVWTALGAKQYKFAPLNFRALREGLSDKLIKLNSMKGGLPTTEDIGVICEVIHASLRRNYSDLDIAFVEDRVDMQNFQHVLNAVLQVTALPIKEGDPPPGEATP